MTHKSITSVDFEKYLSLIKGLYANACELAVCDVEGLPLLTSSMMDKSELARLIALPEGQSLGEDDVQEKVNIRKLGDNRTLYSLGMVPVNDTPLAILVLIVDQNSLPDTVCNRNEFKLLLINIAALIKHEYMLNKELNAMADELGERYDELNLVYEADESPQEVHGALMQIVENCVTYMGVGLVVLSMPDKDILISHSNDVRKLNESQIAIDKAKNNLYHKMKEDNGSIILNKQAEVKEMCPGLSCKVLSSPVFSESDQLEGLIITAKNMQSPDYNNSDRKLLEVMSKKITQLIQSNYDTLTGLLNRDVFELHAEEKLLTARKAGSIHAFLYIDLDDIQVINETISHQVGDNLIKNVANVIQKQVRDKDIIARIGGDEFGLILENCTLESGVQIANKILDAIRELGFTWDNKQLEISATIGVVLIDTNKENAASILTESELAMEAAKELGKNRVHVFQRDDTELLRRKGEMQWVTRIKAALRDDRFMLYAQPIVPLQDNSVAHHIEILLRLQDEDGSILAPFAFIPAAERYHLMPEIDRWVVNQTLTTLSEQTYSHAGLQIKVAINLSGQSLGDQDFLNFLLDRLGQVNLPMDHICFEVTESAAISNFAEAQHFMSLIKEKGCKFSLDDFGTGLSSFAYLKNLPVDYLKIDGSFVKEIINDPISNAMVSAINQVGQVMGLETIAEFVENDAIRDHLKILGVSYGQGYGLGMPRPILEQLEDMVR